MNWSIERRTAGGSYVGGFLATDDVLRTADQAVDRVREYRDLPISGSHGGSPEETAAMDAYKKAIKVLRQAMRADMSDAHAAPSTDP